MLAHASHKPDEVVGHMRSTHFREYWEYTVEKVAVNAVTAGASPEYFPVILALAASGASARGSTTSSAAAMAVVNGPIRHELGMNAGTGTRTCATCCGAWIRTTHQRSCSIPLRLGSSSIAASSLPRRS